MKSAKFFPMLVCAIFIIVTGIGFSENTAEYMEPARVVEVGEPIIKTSLKGIKEIVPYVEVYWTGAGQTSELDERIEGIAAKLLSGAQIKVGSSEPNEAMRKLLERRIQENNVKNPKIKIRSADLPELIIRIYAIKHEPTKSYVFNVQTSVSRNVYTMQSLRSATNAEVWRIDTGPSAVDANNFEVVLKAAVEGQVKRFIEEHKKANSGRAAINEKDYRTQRLAPIPKESKTTDEQGQYYYISSKNSPVFHKSTCSSAGRISSDNLVTYKNREEAIQSGKRPCKTCKP